MKKTNPKSKTYTQIARENSRRFKFTHFRDYPEVLTLQAQKMLVKSDKDLIRTNKTVPKSQLISYQDIKKDTAELQTNTKRAAKLVKKQLKTIGYVKGNWDEFDE